MDEAPDDKRWTGYNLFRSQLWAKLDAKGEARVLYEFARMDEPSARKELVAEWLASKASEREREAASVASAASTLAESNAINRESLEIARAAKNTAMVANAIGIIAIASGICIAFLS